MKKTMNFENFDVSILTIIMTKTIEWLNIPIAFVIILLIALYIMLVFKR